jgi:hypothetical protein
MTQLHQIQLTYVPIEDRALLRLSTDDSCEYRFWITRRYAKLLWPALTRSLQSEGNVITQKEPGAKSAVLAFQHEAAIAGSDFKTEFKSAKLQTPLGDEPILLVRIHSRRLGDNLTLLAMHPEHGQGLELNLNNQLLHSLTKLLRDAANAGDWQLTIEIGLDSNSAKDPTQSQGRH